MISSRVFGLVVVEQHGQHHMAGIGHVVLLDLGERERIRERNI